jgi:hypothetical protein
MFDFGFPTIWWRDIRSPVKDPTRDCCILFNFHCLQAQRLEHDMVISSEKPKTLNILNLNLKLLL